MTRELIHAYLQGLPENYTVLPGANGTGAFVRVHAEKPSARIVFPLGSLTGITRFTSCHRYEPFWMYARCGKQGGEVPIETQFLLAEAEGEQFVAFVPLTDGVFRFSLQGAGEDGLELVGESGDPATVGRDFVGLYVAVGDNPFTLMETAARSVMAHLKTGRLRTEKALPAFADQFGWCTWDAFYQEVSEEKVRLGLESFRAGGVEPRLLILDDGWQSVRETETREKRLTSFAANEKFPGDLAPVVQAAKGEYGIETFLVWHALHGYWGGVDNDALPGYGVRSIARQYSPGIRHYGMGVEEWFGAACGVVAPEHTYRFYQDYHRHLRTQGVDGVKVDNQSAVEGVAAGLGGRVPIMQCYHEALEGSVQTQFQGNLINCMSCANEMLYGALNSTLTRTSTDFWPNQPETHGRHLFTNAQVSLWFGEFVHPDWDMFQSAHPLGAYHAAGRAVGGCPVYVSDKPDAHDFDLLRKLVLPDGSILRALRPGRPTRDCLFHDPTQEDVLLKIFNVNSYGGVAGIFHARYSEAGAAAITGHVKPCDIDGLAGEQFAVYAHYAQELRVLGREEGWELTLEQLTAEVFTVMPIQNGFAPLGLVEMFNSGGAVTHWKTDTISLRAGGRFAAYAVKAPNQVLINGTDADFTYDPATFQLTLAVPQGKNLTLRIINNSGD